jgi:cob(I)alamin adenosyltransferase
MRISWWDKIQKRKLEVYGDSDEVAAALHTLVTELGPPFVFGMNRIADNLGEIVNELHRLAGPDEFDKETDDES